MMRFQFPLAILVLGLIVTACNNLDYQTTASGMKYKIFDGGSTDSTRPGNWLKANIRQTLRGDKDTILGETYGRMPAFIRIQDLPATAPGQGKYGPEVLFGQLKKGDSLVAIMFVDSLINKGIVQPAALPAYVKKGGKLILTIKVMEVFRSDSLANIDRQKEQEKDAPRARKEQEEQMKKMKADQEAAARSEIASLEKSGEKDRQIGEVKKALEARNIAAIQTPMGTLVKIDDPGTGPQVADGKYVTVKYDGRHLRTDSSFDANQFTIQLGVQPMIRGFEDGLRQFKKGGRGTIYIPGYLAYGKEGNGGNFQPYEPLYFEVEIINLSDTDPAVQPAAPHPPQP